VRLRDELEGRYAATVRAELSVPGTRPPPQGWPEPRLPPALRESMIAAAQLEDDARCPEALAGFYTERMPRLLVEQLFRGESAGARLIWMPIDPSRTPRLVAALRGICVLLTEEDLSADDLLGVASAELLFAARLSAAQVASRTLLGSGLPMVGAYPAERALLDSELVQGAAHDVLDLRLSGNLVHELCHGPRREREGAPPPWFLLESAAIHLGATAFPRHVHPEVPGEAVPGVSMFVLAGDALARLFGKRALWSLVVEDSSVAEAFGPAAAAALETAGWQEWLRRREPPFALDAADAVAWVKLADSTRAQGPLSPLVARAAKLGSLRAPRELPDLPRAADAVPWRELPWWREQPTPADRGMARRAVRAVFQADVLAPTFQTHPLRAARLVLDVEACTVTRERVAQGVGAGEPARWILPPPMCRLLWERGVRRLDLGEIPRERADAVAEEV